MRQLLLATPNVSARASLALEAGPPFTIGYEGDWRILSGTVLPIHALVYFDGDALHVSSTDEDVPLFVDGHPVGTSWTALRRSCRITMGAVSFDYLTGEIAPAAAITQRTLARQPEVMAVLGRWAPVAAVGFVAVALLFVAVTLRHRTPARAASAIDHAQEKTVAVAVAAAPTSAPVEPPKVVAAAAGVVVHPVTHPARTRIGKSPERLAADAFHAGDRKKAATLYGELATQHPDNPAFDAVARILGAP